MNRRTLIKHISLLIGSLLSLIFSLILYIQSFEFYSDEYGTDLSFNEDYSVAVIASLLVFIYLLYALNKKSKGEECAYSNWVKVAVTSIVSFYSLGKFFKTLFKAINKGKEFDFTSNQAYLYIGLVVLAIFIYFLLSLIEERSKKKEKE